MEMKRSLLLASEILLGANEAVVELQQNLVASMALELSLLLNELAHSLRLRARSGASVVLEPIDDNRVSKSSVVNDSDGSVRFFVGRNQVDYLHAVLLRAYRDQMAEVNHVHIEGERGGSSFDLTVMFDVSCGPLSPEEADSLLR